MTVPTNDDIRRNVSESQIRFKDQCLELHNHGMQLLARLDGINLKEDKEHSLRVTVTIGQTMVQIILMEMVAAIGELNKLNLDYREEADMLASCKQMISIFMSSLEAV